jgi:hypothetical protein
MRKYYALPLVAFFAFMGSWSASPTAPSEAVSFEAAPEFEAVAMNISSVNKDVLAACQTCASSWNGSNHTFWAGSCEATEITDDYGGCYDCHAANSCHSDTQTGYCRQYHYPCGAGLLKHDLELALRSLDVDAVSRLITNNPAVAVFGEDSRAIQIHCEGLLVEEVIVPEAVLAQLRASLRTPV